MEKTDLGFFLITEAEYTGLDKIDPNITYVLVNDKGNNFVVVKNGQLMGMIDTGLKKMDLTYNALRKTADEKKMTAEKKAVSQLNKVVSSGSLSGNNSSLHSITGKGLRKQGLTKLGE